MSGPLLPAGLAGVHIYMVGIKGTGMAALAEILNDSGAAVTGSDVHEQFYTDELLRRSNIRYAEGFDGANLPDRIDLVIHSAAWDPASHPELLEARRRGVPMLTYTAALGELSQRSFSVGIAGVHGKTTTTALVACAVRGLGLPGTVLAGSALPDAGGRATLVQGHDFFVAETCEYRRHFLSFAPSVALITSVEPDHLDYFSGMEDIISAFVEFGAKLASGGVLIYCADDPGAVSVAQRLAALRPDVRFAPYGLSARGAGRVTAVRAAEETLAFAAGGTELTLRIPGRHNALNAAGAFLVCRELVRSLPGASLSEAELEAGVRRAFAAFRGTRRRSEVVGEQSGILVLDDYGHHPTAIRTTLAGYREFYPGRRIILSFMSHTYSRTVALLDDFARALAEADMLVLHDIYASAREANPGGVDGEVLAVAVHRYSDRVHYVPGVLAALPLVERLVRPGDLFVTMGAGDNWRLGPALIERLADREEEG